MQKLTEKIESTIVLIFSTMTDYTKEFRNTDKYLIYSEFTTKMPVDMGGSTIGGSLIVGSANTVKEAEQIIEVLKERSREFNEKFPSSDKERTKRYVFIENKSEWWPQ